jgi:hypothetical protein
MNAKQALDAVAATQSNDALLCPSAQPGMPGAIVLGVVGGDAEAPRVGYLNERLAVTDDLLARTGSVKPTEVFRFAANCEERACRHFDGTHCRLASRIVEFLPAVSDALPPCLIRKTCRWFAEEGKPACLRCPQVVTENSQPSDMMRRAALDQPAEERGGP